MKESIKKRNEEIVKDFGTFNKALTYNMAVAKTADKHHLDIGTVKRILDKNGYYDKVKK